ncbi:MAG TPA: carbohydrate kinase [Anaeromyxobacteraceae bacterium]|nr:carbohydrate kinase [Anaeromyxobacteraceae bacterium]
MKDETLPPFDASALGELLVDLTPAGTSPHGSALFERNAGGAPANVLAFLAKLGLKTAFLGKVGNDPCGRFLLHVLREAGIDLSGLRTSRTAPTTLALVELGEGGERSFSFYRNPGADSELSPTELDLSVISRSQVFHFGSVSLTLEPSRSATFAALEHARQGGKTISFDPNLRPLLWKSLSEAKKAILSALPYATILKVSRKELQFLTGESDPVRGMRALRDRWGTLFVLVTLGAMGCLYQLGDVEGKEDAFRELASVDTTGAGDAFLGGILYGMLANGISHPSRLPRERLPGMARFACAAAGLTTTRRGAIAALPTLAQIEALVASQERNRRRDSVAPPKDYNGPA